MMNAMRSVGRYAWMVTWFWSCSRRMRSEVKMAAMSQANSPIMPKERWMKVLSVSCVFTRRKIPNRTSPSRAITIPFRCRNHSEANSGVFLSPTLTISVATAVATTRMSSNMNE